MKIIFIIALLAAYACAWQSFAPGQGPFDHLTNEEFAAQYLMSADFAPNDVPPTMNVQEFAEAFEGRQHFDWRNTSLSHCVGQIRDQGRCGSCWAHATSEFMSDRFCIQNNGTAQIKFAPQYMVDCANSTWLAEGCNGADTQTSIKWLANYGMVNESCYPYFSGTTEKAGQCFNTTCPSGEYRVRYDVAPGSVKLHYNYTNVEIARDIFENGPLYLSMVVFGDFKAYRSGVYYPISYEVLGTHAVKCLGWGWDDQKQSFYWICANSWTTNWGENGFFRIGMNNHIGYLGGSAKNYQSRMESEFISI